MFKAITVGRHVISLFLQGVLQNGIPFKTLTLLVDLRIKQRLLCL
ncbi:Uncharacterised protein [Salmonella enterica subsp. enterica serovar Bovismorbificans]|uniref:Uncharacterized protein n=1 Tax=Salmonella enterica subsp. enterica serovar Bovismorbificans TaxID=58097 RepID=A0A655EBA8_SALET|nr:Uncharacterised protein [Salmonella enterica subsp. enterica serovar Bovismorbificans]